jgi:hypothetical protein
MLRIDITFSHPLPRNQKILPDTNRADDAPSVGFPTQANDLQ